jgi:GT2 family glycosyltransferase
MEPIVSIIIAVGTPGDYIRECIEHCGRLDYPRFEIIVLPDDPWEPTHPNIRVIPTGKVRPAEKRDRGVAAAEGEIVAIIDDDAYPDTRWLANAVRHFADPAVAAVGGPGVTPPADSLRQKVSGWVYESPLVSGGFAYRYRPGRMQDVDDYPTSSLVIRKADFLAAGGFDTGYWPGEDTILCMKLTHERGKRIVYDPDVIVYHHRRPVFRPHLRQIRSYALHRGFFAKRFPRTSLRLSYFVPSIFTLFLGLGWMTAFIGRLVFLGWVSVIGLYVLLVLLSSARTVNPAGFLLTAAGTIATHLTYGVWFIAGFVAREVRD